MKYIKLYTPVLVIIALMFSACTDSILEREEKDVVPADRVLNTLAGVEAVLFQVYQAGRSPHQNPDISLFKQCGTDLVRNGTHMVDVPEAGMRGMNTYSSGFSAVSNLINDIWDVYYGAISNCNLVIQASETFEANTDQEEAQLLAFKGEALAMRAYFYLDLVRRWENVPISVPLEPGAPPATEAPLAPKEVIYDLIISDLTEAVQLLPTRIENGSVGKPSKGLANLLLAETYLDLGMNAEAAQAADAVINDASYAFQPLDMIFGQEGGKLGVENNNEIIFSWIFDPAVIDQSQYTSVMYTPLYDRVPGIARTMAQGGRPWSRFSPSEYYWTLFEEGDGRLEAWHKLAWILDDPDEIIPESGKSEGELAVDGYIDLWCSTDLECRYLEPTTTKHWEGEEYGRTTAEGEGYRNIIVYRWSQAYILGAEAHFKAGNVTRATELINALRERAYGNSDHNFTSVDMNVIMDEQARELGHEGHRWYILKRNGMLMERVMAHNPDAAPNIQSKHVRWPIPQTFVDLAGVEQNEGY